MMRIFSGKKGEFSMHTKSFHLSVQGASHIQMGKECQDHSLSFTDENCTAAIVCDGHGGNDYIRSAYGARFACEAAKKNIKIFAEKMDKESFFNNANQYLRTLEASIISDWNNMINQHLQENPFTQEELEEISEKAEKKYVQDGHIESAYGTTMIAAVVTQTYWFSIQIGDGKCVVFLKNGDCIQPIPWDPNCFLNVTTSICDSEALQNFRHFYSEERPVAIFIGSDGVDDCFVNDEQLYHLYQTILFSFSTTDFDEAFNVLSDYLPRLSAKGSGDDISIAAILDMGN